MEHQPDGVCGCRGAACSDATQADPAEHDQPERDPGRQPAHLSPGCQAQPPAVGLQAACPCRLWRHSLLLSAALGQAVEILSPLGLAPQPPLSSAALCRWTACVVLTCVPGFHGQPGLSLASSAHPSGICGLPVCRMVVVLEKRTMVYALETLELLTTLDTHSNPKASWDLWPWQQREVELKSRAACA